MIVSCACSILDVLQLVPGHIPLSHGRIVTSRIMAAMEAGDEAAARDVWRDCQVTYILQRNRLSM